MLQAGIICGNAPDRENAQLKEAFERAGVGCHIVEPADVGIGVGTTAKFFHKSVPVDDIPGFIVRGVGLTLLNKAYYRFDLLYALEHRGRVLINSAASSERALDKVQTSVMLDSRGIPTPRTVVAENIKHAISAFDLLGGDVLVKPIYGSQGIGIFKLTEKAFAERVFLEMFQLGHVFYIQEFHPFASPPSMARDRPFDARFFIIGGEVVGTMLREAPSKEHWKTNIHQGASPRPFSPGPDSTRMAIQAADALGLEIAGVDLMYSGKSGGWIVLEVNCAPGWTGLMQVCDQDIPLRIAHFYKERMKR